MTASCFLLFHAGVAELADAPESKSGAARRVGSTPTSGTISSPGFSRNRGFYFLPLSGPGQYTQTSCRTGSRLSWSRPLASWGKGCPFAFDEEFRWL
jgi:hypothetical protein